jgi:hypothetical protein
MMHAETTPVNSTALAYTTQGEYSHDIRGRGRSLADSQKGNWSRDLLRPIKWRMLKCHVDRAAV